MKTKTRILVLAANPLDTRRLRLDKEISEIEEGLLRATKRDRFHLEKRLAVRPADLRHALLDLEPQIVHFCGHGASESGIFLEHESGNGTSQPVNPAALARLFALCPQVECVVLNSCYTEVQAREISQHIRYVVGMHGQIHDRAAIKFAVGFYDALGAGQSIERAFHFGRSAIELELAGLPDHLAPVLLINQSALPHRDSGRGDCPGVHRGGDTDFAVLGKLSRQELDPILKRYKAALTEDADDPDAHFSLGLVYLQLKLHDLAQRHFQKTLELSPDCPEAHFYYALSLVRARRPRTLALQEIRTIEGHISAAMELDQRPAKYNYLLAILRYDYYRGNGLGVPPPTDAELLAAAGRKELDAWEVERMLSAVIVREPQLLATIRRT